MLHHPLGVFVHHNLADVEAKFTSEMSVPQAREAAELAVLRGQSAQRSWFFIQSARIGAINANVSISLTSSILAARSGDAPAAAAASGASPSDGGGPAGGSGGSGGPAGAVGGLFSRLIGASGFQLVRAAAGPTHLLSISGPAGPDLPGSLHCRASACMCCYVA